MQAPTESEIPLVARSWLIAICAIGPRTFANIRPSRFRAIRKYCLTLTEARSILAVVSRGLTLPDGLVKRAEAKAHAPLRYALMKDSTGWHIIDGDGGIVSSHETREQAQLELDNLAAEHEKIAPHGEGGDDDTTKAIALSLPPLTGRSLADKQAELLGQIRGMFDPTELLQKITDKRDQLRGRV